MKEDILKTLLEHNLSFIEQVASTSMTWWVSAIVFCPTIVAAFWYHKEKLIDHPHLKKLLITATVFLLSFPVYAAYVYCGVRQVEADTKTLLLKLGVTDVFPYSFTGIRGAMVIGGLCFVTACCGWAFVFIDLWKASKRTP